MTDYEAVEGLRFADALDAVESGAQPDIDPREDPELDALVRAASLLGDHSRSSTDSDSFRSYSQRSRALVMRSVEANSERALIPVAARDLVTISAPDLPFYRRWSFWTPSFAAASASVLALAIFLNPGLSPFSEGGPGVFASARTPGEIDGELAQVRQALAEIEANGSRGELVSAELLERLTEGTIGLAQQISVHPQSVSQEQVVAYIQTAYLAQAALEAAEAEGNAIEILEAARRTAEDGFVVASRYLVENLRQQQASADDGIR